MLRLLCLVGLCAFTSAFGADDKIFNLPYALRELPNGLRVVAVKTDYPDIVSLQIPIQTGSRNEVEPGKSGFAHFFEHMMFRGTERYPAAAYAAAVNAAGGDQNAYTTDDFTNYHITFTKADLEKMLMIEADRFMHLEYTEAQFRTEALSVKGEYLKNYSNPLQKLFETVRDLSFTAHSYKHTTMGFLKDIEDMPNQIEYAKLFFDRWYRPEKASVIVVGDIDPQATLALVEKYFGVWRPGDYQARIPVEPPPAGGKQRHIKWETRTQPYIVSAFRGPAFKSTDKEMPSMDLLGQVWFAETSDLYQRLVVKEQWVDQFFYSSPDRKDPNLIMIGARLIKPEYAKVVNEAIEATLARARTERVSPDKLRDIKSALKYGFASGLDNSAAIAAMLASTMQVERDPETVNRQYRMYDALTSDDLLAAANRYFVDRGRVLVTLSDADALPGVTLGALDALAQTPSRAQFASLERPGSSPLVSVNLLFASGAAFDPPGKKGLAQLTANMIVDGGSQARGIRELTQQRYPMAAEFTAQVDKEMISLRGTVHRDNLRAWSALALEQLLTPAFGEDDFKRVKTNLINAIRSDLRGNNDEELAKEALYQAAYGEAHPYGVLSLGDVSDLEKLTLDDVREFYRSHFSQANLTLGVAGGYDAAWLTELKRSLGQLPAGAARTIELPKPRVQGRRALLVQKETSSVAVSFGFPLDVKRGDKDWVALWLARSYLGEHRQSGGRLFQRIREARGMNYGDYAYVEYFPRGMFQFFPDANLARRQQLFQIWIRPLRTNSDAVFATRAALYELERLIKNGLSAEQFNKQRQYLQKFASQLAKNQAQQLGYALDSRYYGIGDFSDYVRRELAKLTVQDVNRALRKHLQVKDLQFVFVSKDAADLAKRLIGGAPSAVEYPAPKPELAQEDAIIGKLPLRLSNERVTIAPVEQVFE